MIEPAASRESRRQGSSPTAAHLDVWDRYGQILAAQLAALEAPDPDLDRFHELADERDALAREIDAIDPGTNGSDPGPDPLLRDTLQSIGATDRAVLQKLRTLGHEVGQAVQDLDERRPGRMGYLAGSARPKGHSVDVTY